jgi:hypothetical protein
MVVIDKTNRPTNHGVELQRSGASVKRSFSEPAASHWRVYDERIKGKRSRGEKIMGMNDHNEAWPPPDMCEPTVYCYVAGPMRGGDTADNIRTATLAADTLWRAGFTPYLPHDTHFRQMICPHSFKDWIKYDFRWLRLCDCVVRLPGFSVGADMETAEAIRQGIPVICGVDNAVGQLATLRENKWIKHAKRQNETSHQCRHTSGWI